MAGGAAGGDGFRLRPPRLITERPRKIGVVGVYEPSDEGAAAEDAKQGRYDFDYRTAFTEGIIIGSGQCPVMRYHRWLRDLIIRGQATPSRVISHELPLDWAVRAYDQFDKRTEAGPRSSSTRARTPDPQRGQASRRRNVLTASVLVCGHTGTGSERGDRAELRPDAPAGV